MERQDNMLKIFFIIILSIIAVTQFVLELIEMNDRKRGIKVNYRDYTIFGMLRLMHKERKEKRKGKQKKNNGKNFGR